MAKRIPRYAPIPERLLTVLACHLCSDCEIDDEILITDFSRLFGFNRDEVDYLLFEKLALPQHYCTYH